ncbi:hypothetical protein MKW92_026140 [Papaver armeniacum]|nr:hypothetical protein MKW92_026140 [Papaver armeniacum]
MQTVSLFISLCIKIAKPPNLACTGIGILLRKVKEWCSSLTMCCRNETFVLGHFSEELSRYFFYFLNLLISIQSFNCGCVGISGNYPEWDEDHPIHFVAHSAGVQVVRALQQMLADKAWLIVLLGFQVVGNTSENSVLSTSPLSGAFNGTTRTYLDGMQQDDGRSMKPICLLQLCRLGVIIYYWLDIPWLKAYYNYESYGLVDLLLGNTCSFALGDWILPDLTIRGSMMLNSHLHTFPNTYIFSTHPPDVPLPYKGYRDEDWQDNDGALSTISMTYIRLPNRASQQIYQIKITIWCLIKCRYHKIVEGDHILFIVNLERAGVRFHLI